MYNIVPKVKSQYRLGIPHLSPAIHPLPATLRKGNSAKKVKNYLVFYCLVDSKVEIIRVIHGARDIAAILDDLGEVDYL